MLKLKMGNKLILIYRGPCNKIYKKEFDIEKIDISETAKVDYQCLSTVFERNKFEWDRLNEIKKILGEGHLRSALILALTLPDICSKNDSNLNGMKSDERYAKWFDENIVKYNKGEVGKEGDSFDCFNGYMCYLLRCRMIHGEPIDIEEVPNRKQSSFKKAGYRHVYFKFINGTFSEFFEFSGSFKVAFFYKSIPQLVMQILSCADLYYREEPNKSKFFDSCNIQSLEEMQYFLF